MIQKEYLGDSVYVELEGGQLKLTTENSENPTNVIYMEKSVFTALIRFTQKESVRKIF
jgi:hypothetical protein